jgi:competence ComEA-like helix-hairpin-helix protein
MKIRRWAVPLFFFLFLCFIISMAVTLYPVAQAWLSPAPSTYFMLKEPSVTVLPHKRLEKRIDLNHASLAELMTLPGIGEVTADAILIFREEHKRINYVEDLLEVRGIGQTRLETIYERVYIGE